MNYERHGKKKFNERKTDNTTPLRKNIPYVHETRTKNEVFLTRRKKSLYQVYGKYNSDASEQQIIQSAGRNLSDPRPTASILHSFIANPNLRID